MPPPAGRRLAPRGRAGGPRAGATIVCRPWGVRRFNVLVEGQVPRSNSAVTGRFGAESSVRNFRNAPAENRACRDIARSYDPSQLQEGRSGQEPSRHRERRGSGPVQGLWLRGAALAVLAAALGVAGQANAQRVNSLTGRPEYLNPNTGNRWNNPISNAWDTEIHQRDQMMRMDAAAAAQRRALKQAIEHRQAADEEKLRSDRTLAMGREKIRRGQASTSSDVQPFNVEAWMKSGTQETLKNASSWWSNAGSRLTSGCARRRPAALI